MFNRFVVYVSLICLTKSEWIEISQSPRNYMKPKPIESPDLEVPADEEVTTQQNFITTYQSSIKRPLKSTTTTSSPFVLEKREEFFEATPEFAITTEETATGAPIKKKKSSVKVSANKYDNGGGYTKEFATTKPEETTTGAPFKKKKASDKVAANKYDNGVESTKGLLPFLSSVQDTLTKTSDKSLRSKILLLNGLRDTLLWNIKTRIASLWKTPSSEAREYKGDNDMHFPSNEGALMTIGFLTFAVFLIKLVLKLIHLLKNKNNNTMVYPTMDGGTLTYYGRKKRDIGEENRILQLIEDFGYN